MKSNILPLFVLLFLISCQNNQQEINTIESYNLIPQPVELTPQNGSFEFNENTKIVIPQNEEIKTVANNLLSISKDLSTNNIQTENTESHAIIIELKDFLEEEKYTLSVNSERILIQAKNATGVFYASQTLRQLANENSIPAVEIVDYPRFAYRGMHLDVSRHFFDVAAVKRFIDQLAYHKINRFHWHLTDDQGWRVEIKNYPKLTEISAFRKETLIGHFSDDPQQFDSKKYGGFYTQEEIKEVVDYAAANFITIVPEIEMPGHSVAVLAAYPELACTAGPFEAGTKWGVFEDVFCPKEETFEFLENVLTEVMDLFPGEYIHIGGDECPKTRWEESAFCQQLIKEKDLKDEHGLQSYFIQRIEKFVNSKGRKIIGWDEILEGGIAPNAAVMSWRGEEGGIEAAKQRHDVVMTPTTYCYFDYYQSPAKSEPLAIGGLLPLKKVYSYNPVPAELDAEESKHIIGVQANLWTEYIPTEEKLQYMMFPRACALSEIAWSPDANKDYPDFTRRLLPHIDRLKSMGIQSANHLLDVKSDIKAGNGVQVELKKEAERGVIHYTTDDSPPTAESPIYSDAINITKDANLRAQSFIENKATGNGITEIFKWHKAAGKAVELSREPHPKYAGNGGGSIVNGVNGDERYGGAEWLGFKGESVDCVIDFGEKTDFKQANMRFYKGQGQWIYLPKSVRISSSDDGETYIELAKIGQVEGEGRGQVIETNIKFSHSEGRYLKFEIENFGMIPAGSQGSGHRAWLFVDEIAVN